MSTARIYQLGAVTTSDLKLRIYRTQAVGDVPAAPKLRIYRAALTGAVAVTVTAPDNIVQAEPGIPVTVTAALTSGGTPTWQWRHISGQPTTINGTGPTVSIVPPFILPNPDGGAPNDSVLTFGVRATVDGTTSTEQTFTMQVNPWPGPWIYQGGSTWAGVRPKVLT